MIDGSDWLSAAGTCTHSDFLQKLKGVQRFTMDNVKYFQGFLQYLRTRDNIKVEFCFQIGAVTHIIIIKHPRCLLGFCFLNFKLYPLNSLIRTGSQAASHAIHVIFKMITIEWPPTKHRSLLLQWLYLFWLHCNKGTTNGQV